MNTSGFGCYSLSQQSLPAEKVQLLVLLILLIIKNDFFILSCNFVHLTTLFWPLREPVVTVGKESNLWFMGGDGTEVAPLD